MLHISNLIDLKSGLNTQEAEAGGYPIQDIQREICLKKISKQTT